MTKLLHNIRFYVLVFSVCLSALIYGWVITTISSPALQIIRLTELFALTAVTFLYLAVIAGPFCFTFKQVLPAKFRAKYLKARRALGVSAFYFAFIHANFAFFGELGGFPGLAFLTPVYLIGITLSFTALIILFLMAATSFDKMVTLMTFPKWKRLHRFVYLAGLFVVIHALLLGTNFSDLSSTIPQVFFAALSFLLLLEGLRIDAQLRKRWPQLPAFGLVTILFICLAVVYFLFSFLAKTGAAGVSLNVHAQHIALAQQAQSGGLNLPSNINTSQIPGLQGDPTLRFTVGLEKPDVIQPNQDVTLRFPIYNANNGNPVELFTRVYTKLVHLVIVDNELSYFAHIHPDQDGNAFVITTQFPHPGEYHLYLDYQPLGAIEQQTGLSLIVGDTTAEPAKATQPVDTTLTKTFGTYQVSLDTHGELYAKELSLGQQKLTFTIKDAKTKQPVTDLKPYLASFGHLVMINEKTYDYLHVHPNNLVAPPPDASSGPTVEFLPLGLYGPIKPGVYRLFAQFNPGNNLMTADFTIQIH